MWGAIVWVYCLAVALGPEQKNGGRIRERVTAVFELDAPVLHI